MAVKHLNRVLLITFVGGVVEVGAAVVGEESDAGDAAAATADTVVFTTATAVVEVHLVARTLHTVMSVAVAVSVVGSLGWGLRRSNEWENYES